MAGKIFVNYRRDDERATAARIRDRLAASFGDRNVFMDVDNLLAGQRFDKELETALAHCDVFIAVIGNQWASLLAERQAANERDFVVDEIAAAIARGIPVIPVLVDGSPLPQAEVLPASIVALPLHQTHEVKHESFGRDVEALIGAIKAVRKPGLDDQGRSRRSIIVAALVAAVVIAGGIGGYFAYQHLEAERKRVQAIADAQAERITRLAREVEEGRRKAEAERQRKEAERKRAEDEKRRKAEALRRQEQERNGRIKVLVGLPGREKTRLLKPGAGKTEWFKDCAHCPEMVVVPAGSFQMGSKDGHKAETPVHTVTIAKPFSVGRFEVTFAEWDACVAAGDCKHKPADKGWGRGRRPVINVSWKDAKQYVAWLSKTTGKRYRLLSEAEWEYAARAGTTTRSTTSMAGLMRVINVGKTVEVGSLKPNAFGLYDMHGNVWEWTADCWQKSYAGAPGDGSPWTTGDCRGRVLRWGAWFISRNDRRSTNRGWSGSVDRKSFGGFRIARTL